MIINIKSNEKLDKAVIGNKAYQLNQMFHLGFHISDGYVLEPDFFDTFCSFNSISSKDTDFSEKIRKGIFPGFQRDLLDSIFQKITGGTGAVIVRSSSLEEDSANGSFAGIYESVGNISDCADMLEAIKTVWASYYAEYVEAYREIQHISMPVIIQKMIECDKAGVLFTRNPLTHEQQYVVEACMGNNDKIMKNECMAERYVVSEGTPEKKQNKVLSNRELKKLVYIAEKIEQKLEFPCDIEWGIAGGIYYLFQVRPIVFTAEVDIYYHIKEDLDCILLDRYSKPASVCYLSMLDAWQDKVYLSYYSKKRGKELPLCFLYNRVYWNKKYQLKYFQDSGESSLYKKIRFYFLVRNGYKKWYKKLSNYDKNMISFQKRIENTADQEEIVNLLKDVTENFCIYIGIDHYRFLGIAQILYQKMEKSMKEGNIDVEILKIIGTKTNKSKTVQVNQELLKLAECIRGTREYYQLFINNDEYIILSKLESVETYQPLWKQLQKFLEKHGHRGVDCDDLYYPHWNEHPQSVITLLKQFLYNHMDEKAAEDIKLDRISKRQKRLINLCGIYMCLREDQRYYFDKSWVLIRKILLKLADYFIENKMLENKQDIFHLTIKEIVGGVKSPEHFPDKKILSERKEIFQNAHNMIPPYMLKDSVSIPVQKGRGHNSYKVMGVSSGRSVGNIKFINDMRDLANVKKGEIGVVKTFHPSWTPVLKIVSGLIMNYGNILSHGSVIAREYKIPVVVFNGEVQGILSNGDLVEIDGSKGRIHVLQKNKCNVEKVSSDAAIIEDVENEKEENKDSINCT